MGPYMLGVHFLILKAACQSMTKPHLISQLIHCVNVSSEVAEHEPDDPWKVPDTLPEPVTEMLLRSGLIVPEKVIRFSEKSTPGEDNANFPEN